MYGMMFSFLKEYVEQKHGGHKTWQNLLEAAGQSRFKVYFPIVEYPDSEIVALVTTASQALDTPVEAVLEDFGVYVGPRLMTFYRAYVEGHGQDLFTIVQYAGAHIHDQIHQHNPDRKPPQLSAEIHDPQRMTVHYHSHRKFCPVVRGVLRGLGEKFGEQLQIKETQCMHEGAEECTFEVIRHTRKSEDE